MAGGWNRFLSRNIGLRKCRGSKPFFIFKNEESIQGYMRVINFLNILFAGCEELGCEVGWFLGNTTAGLHCYRVNIVFGAAHSLLYIYMPHGSEKNSFPHETEFFFLKIGYL